MRTPRIAVLRFAAAGFVFLAGVAGGAPAAHAQMDPAGTVASKPLKTKPVWIKVQVIHVNHDSMVVRESEHPMIVHTFTFSTKMSAAMEKVRASGGYQRGDEVRIEHEPGKDEALAIRGKPNQAN
jgi:hypothetical protein